MYVSEYWDFENSTVFPGSVKRLWGRLKLHISNSGDMLQALQTEIMKRCVNQSIC